MYLQKLQYFLAKILPYIRGMVLAKKIQTCPVYASETGSTAGAVCSAHLRKINKEFYMNASDFLVKRLYDWGVRRVFGYPGDGINGVMEALNRARKKIEFVQTRHEEIAAFMACGHTEFPPKSRSPTERFPGKRPRSSWCMCRRPANRGSGILTATRRRRRLSTQGMGITY
jgi:hypothetical protein